MDDCNIGYLNMIIKTETDSNRPCQTQKNCGLANPVKNKEYPLIP